MLLAWQLEEAGVTEAAQGGAQPQQDPAGRPAERREARGPGLPSASQQAALRPPGPQSSGQRALHQPLQELAAALQRHGRHQEEGGDVEGETERRLQPGDTRAAGQQER